MYDLSYCYSFIILPWLQIIMGAQNEGLVEGWQHTVCSHPPPPTSVRVQRHLSFTRQYMFTLMCDGCLPFWPRHSCFAASLWHTEHPRPSASLSPTSSPQKQPTSIQLGCIIHCRHTQAGNHIRLQSLPVTLCGVLRPSCTLTVCVCSRCRSVYAVPVLYARINGTPQTWPIRLYTLPQAKTDPEWLGGGESHAATWRRENKMRVGVCGRSRIKTGSSVRRKKKKRKLKRKSRGARVEGREECGVALMRAVGQRQAGTESEQKYLVPCCRCCLWKLLVFQINQPDEFLLFPAI